MHFPRLSRAHCITLHIEGPSDCWVNEWHLLGISITSCSVTNHSKLSGQTILLCSGTLWVRKSDWLQQGGLSCFLIWEDLVGWVDSRAELRRDHWPENWHKASPHGFYHLLACGQVLRGNILRYQERIQVTATWPLSPRLRGHLVSLSPFCWSEQWQVWSDPRRGDMDPTLRGGVFRSLGAMFQSCHTE